MPKSKSVRKGKSISRKINGERRKRFGIEVKGSDGYWKAHAAGDQVGMNIAANLGGVLIIETNPNGRSPTKFQIKDLKR